MLSSCLAVTLILTLSLMALAQDEVETVEVSQAMKELLHNLSAAQVSEKVANSKAAEFIKSAQAAAARLGNSRLSPEISRQERLNVLKFQMAAVQTRLETANRNAELLRTATDSLHVISEDLPGQQFETTGDLPTPEDEPIMAERGREIETAESEAALTAAHDYYEAARKISEDPTMLKTAARGLASWASKNRRAIVLGETQLRKLQLALEGERADVSSRTSSGVISEPQQSEVLQSRGSWIGFAGQQINMTRWAPSHPPPVVITYTVVRVPQQARITFYSTYPYGAPYFVQSPRAPVYLPGAYVRYQPYAVHIPRLQNSPACSFVTIQQSVGRATSPWRRSQ
jgi:hypothetical protein